MQLRAMLYLIVNYFGIVHHTKSVNILNCLNKIDNVKLMKNLSSEGFSIAFILLDDNLNVTHAINDLLRLSKNSSSVGMFFDSDCTKSNNFLQLCSLQRCFAGKYKWLIYDNQRPTNESQVIEQLKTVNLFVDAEITFIQFAETLSAANETLRYAMYDVYNNAYTHGGKLNIIFDRYFEFDENNGGHLTESIIRMKAKYENRNKMIDVTLRLATTIPQNDLFPSTDALMKYLLTDNNTAIDTQSRYSTNTAILIRDILLFNVTIVRYNKWAINDSYGGVIEAIAKDEIDFALSFLLLTPDRLNYFAPLTQLTEFRSHIYFLTATDVDLFGEGLLKPFGKSVWVFLLVTTVLVSIGMKIIFLWDHGPSNGSSIIVAFGAYCQQGASNTPNLLSGRCLFIFLFLSSIMIYNYYTSVLVSTLVLSSSKNKINTIKDLADSKLKLGFEDIPYMRGFLNSTTDPEFKYIIQKKLYLNDESKRSFLSNHDGLKLVQKGQYAFHCEASAAFPIIRLIFMPREICDLNVLRFRRDSQQAFVIRKGSPFHGIFATKLFWLREAGIISKHRRHWVIEKPPCLSNAYVSSVGIESTAALMIFLAMGFTFAMFILICENIYYYLYANK